MTAPKTSQPRPAPKSSVARTRSAPAGGWKSLRVIDQLRVGPVQLERDRLRMPYEVVRKGTPADRFKLTYRYHEPVFDPGSAQHRNLAAMIGVQVALNYGLFCREIRFLDDLDGKDRKFITDMMENTAREITVKKFLEPNPFLTPAARDLDPEPRERYTQAHLVFEGSKSERIAWNALVHPEHPAVLSSGGKDSLLTFGMLRELGLSTDCLFVNESGRHWLTARNAFRYLEAEVPGTARVWTNSDRAFTWFLRHFPFVRSDFQSLRSDEYPIRLWTVAVFLFGVLPLLWKREIGRILVGDEFDTSRRASFRGIRHYDGLYDQSRWFDNELTRYYAAKGWPLLQFSALRNASELLIQKTLTERYPDLQAHQVSCHAAHLEGERVHPCGRCEKCRRIVGMLLAIGADPTRCGYRAEQIEHCRNAMQRLEVPVHQESPGAEHLAFMLGQRLGMTFQGGIRPREHPEILKLRFDPQVAPITDIPADLRRGIHGILLQHATGAVRRQGRAWTSFDPLAEGEVS